MASWWQWGVAVHAHGGSRGGHEVLGTDSLISALEFPAGPVGPRMGCRTGSWDSHPDSICQLCDLRQVPEHLPTCFLIYKWGDGNASSESCYNTHNMLSSLSSM